MTPEGYLITCKRRDCAGFSTQWARDQATRLKHNLPAWGHFQSLVTLTAPGRAVLPFATDLCGHPADGSACTGPKGCVVRPIQAEEWNREVYAKWQRALRRARLYAKRHGIRVTDLKVLAYVPECERGVIHLHVVIGWKGTVRPGEVRWFLSRLKREAVREGFGRQFKATKPTHGGSAQVASYLAKYLTKGGMEALKVVPPRVQPVFVSPVLTRRTGITMRFLRLARRAWHVWGPRDYADLVKFFAWAASYGVDPFTWRRLRPPSRPRPERPWEPLGARPSPVCVAKQLPLF